MRCLVLLLITFAVAKSFPLKNEEDIQQETESDERDTGNVRHPPYDESDAEKRFPPILKRNQEKLVEEMIETPMNDPAPYYGGGGNFGGYGGGYFGGINAPYGGGSYNGNYGQQVFATPVPANQPYGGWVGGSVSNQIGSNLGGGYGGYGGYYGKRMIAKPATDPGFIGGGGGGGGGGRK